MWDRLHTVFLKYTEKPKNSKKLYPRQYTFWKLYYRPKPIIPVDKNASLLLNAKFN